MLTLCPGRRATRRRRHDATKGADHWPKRADRQTRTLACKATAIVATPCSQRAQRAGDHALNATTIDVAGAHRQTAARPIAGVDWTVLRGYRLRGRVECPGEQDPARGIERQFREYLRSAHGVTER